METRSKKRYTNDLAENKATTRRGFYDKESILDIPILDVAYELGVEIHYKGGNPWCRLRSDDDTASTILHPESDLKYPNTFHDFGSGEHGDVIKMTMLVRELSWKDAVQYLGQTFHIPPQDRTKQNEGHLSNREYASIGLYGDLSTKNFSFGSDMEQNHRISEKFSMSMNELKEEHPRTYERVLKQVAIPFVQEERNGFYMDLYMTRGFLKKAYGVEDSIFTVDKFNKKADSLSAMDRALTRAMIGTRLEPEKARDYSPRAVLADIDSGKLKPAFGNKTFKQMQRLSEAKKTNVSYETVDLDLAFYEGTSLFGSIPFTAFLKNGTAVIGYMECDRESVRPILTHMALKDKARDTAPHKNGFGDKIKNAEIRSATGKATGSASKNTKEAPAR